MITNNAEYRGWNIIQEGFIADIYRVSHCGRPSTIIGRIAVCSECGNRIEMRVLIQALSLHQNEMRPIVNAEVANNHTGFATRRINELLSMPQPCPACGVLNGNLTDDGDGVRGICIACESPFFIGID